MTSSRIALECRVRAATGGLAGFAILAIVALAWQFAEYRSLRAQPTTGAQGEPIAADPSQQIPPQSDRDRPLDNTRRPLPQRRTQLQASSGDAVSWRKRIAGQRELLSKLLGRAKDESAEDYRARTAPLLKAALAVPRQRVEERRKQAEQRAGVTERQREQIAELLDTAYSETLELANEAVASGDLTPYARNMAGLFSFAGSLGPVFENGQSGLEGILSPAQLRAMSAAGFDWTEYIGLNAPWEDVNAPPPPPNGRE